MRSGLPGAGACPSISGRTPASRVHLRASGGGGGPSGWQIPVVSEPKTKHRHGFWQPTDLLQALPQAGTWVAAALNCLADTAPADRTAASMPANNIFLTMHSLLESFWGRRRRAFWLANACGTSASQAKTKTWTFTDVEVGASASARKYRARRRPQLTGGHRARRQNCRERYCEQRLFNHVRAPFLVDRLVAFRAPNRNADKRALSALFVSKRGDRTILERRFSGGWHA